MSPGMWRHRCHVALVVIDKKFLFIFSCSFFFFINITVPPQFVILVPKHEYFIRTFSSSCHLPCSMIDKWKRDATGPNSTNSTLLLSFPNLCVDFYVAWPTGSTQATLAGSGWKLGQTIRNVDSFWPLIWQRNNQKNLIKDLLSKIN